jgi:DNA-binding response OmpR family regulator
MILEKEGYLVETSFTGNQALKKLRDLKFDLLVSDIRLPDIMGDYLVKKIREKDREIRIILITGYPSYVECIDVLGLGISEILLKPFAPDELINSMEEALKRPIFCHPNLEAWLESKKWN